MRLSKIRRTSSIGFNMTPMIDIVFLLIIFFMTVSQITRVIDHPMPLPNVTWGGAEGVPTTITINVNRQGKIIVSGTEMTLNSVLSALRTRLKAASNDPGRIKVQVRCDRTAESRHVNRLVQELTRLGFSQIRVAVAEE